MTRPQDLRDRCNGSRCRRESELLFRGVGLCPRCWGRALEARRFRSFRSVLAPLATLVSDAARATLVASALERELAELERAGFRIQTARSARQSGRAHEAGAGRLFYRGVRL